MEGCAGGPSIIGAAMRGERAYAARRKRGDGALSSGLAADRRAGG